MQANFSASRKSGDSGFQAALEKTEIKNPARQLIQLKLDALGGKTAG